MQTGKALRALKRPGRVARALCARVPIPGLRRYCVICERHASAFLPFRRGLKDCSPLMLALEVVGGDPVNCACPWCGCTDRDRHLLLYLRATGLIESFRGSRILHLAPEAHLPAILERENPELYVRTDLMKGLTIDLQSDLTCLPFEDGSFDIFIANHVLEHVLDLSTCLREIARVLAPGGFAVLQTPYSPVLTRTFRDPAITTESMRFHAYGQEDHERLFGSDIFRLIAEHGFKADIRHHDSELQGTDAKEMGVNVREPLFLFWKQDQPSPPS